MTTLLEKAKKKGLVATASKRAARWSLVKHWEAHGFGNNWLNFSIDLKIVSEPVSVAAMLDQPLPSPDMAEQTDGNKSLPSGTADSGDMAVTHESDDPTEAVTALAMQMAAGETTGASGSSDTVEFLDVKNCAVSTLPQVPDGTASGYVSNMTSGWDARGNL